MATPGLYNRQAKPTPPLNGSFPLDREAKCKLEMVEYLLCMNDNENVSDKCRNFAKEYLKCRMDQNLMEKDDWEYLGFPEEKKTDSQEKK